MILPTEIEILVIDDLRDNLRLLSNLLTEQGYIVRKATSGIMGLRSAQLEPPHLILLDICMPEMDGYEVCCQLKALEETRHIPVIFTSALDDALDKVKAFQSGGVDYITKPFHVEELLIRVENQLKVQGFTKILEQQIEQMQLQSVQQEKLSALGNLVSGVAHEINNPLGFLAGNIQPALDYVKDLLELIDLYQRKYPNDQDTQEKISAIDLDYIREDLPKSVSSMKEGILRIQEISNSLRTFARADLDYPVTYNIHEGIDSTIMILKHRLKANEIRPEIQVIKQYDHLPEIECYAGQLNQVFMNILANAIDALDESNIGQSFTDIVANPNIITIKTSRKNNQVQISIADNGKGMSEEVKAKIFDHLFTTKSVGKGTGLGLAIAQQIIVEKHHGSLEVQSQIGQGTEFAIELPITASSA